MIGSSDAPEHGEWSKNWPVVLAGAGGLLFSSVYIYSTGVLIAPLEKEFGWTRAEISSGPMIVSFLGLVTGPLVGLAIDRFGARRVALIGACLYCGALALLSTATASIWSWWLLWTVLACAVAFIGPTVWTVAVSSLFFANRGLALAATLCGTGLASGSVPIVTTILLEHFGWRHTYVGLAIFYGLLVLPPIFFLFSSAADQGRQKPAATAEGAKSSEPLPGLTAREGFASLAFLKLAIMAVLFTTAISGFVVNLVPILKSQGLDPKTAAAIAGLLGAGIIVGRLSGGYILDRIDAKIFAAVTIAIPAVSSLMLIAAPGSAAIAVLAVLLMGLTTGASLNAIIYLTSRHFGPRAFGTLFGTISGLLVLINGVAPLLTNYVYDLTHSYQLALWAVAPALFLCALLCLTLGDYPDFDAMARHRGRS